jgi:hypothetical protein
MSEMLYRYLYSSIVLSIALNLILMKIFVTPDTPTPTLLDHGIWRNGPIIERETELESVDHRMEHCTGWNVY